MKFSTGLSAFLLALSAADAACPMGGKMVGGINPHFPRRLEGAHKDGDHGIPDGGFAAVRDDIKKMLTTSQDFFPADFQAPHGPHYGGKQCWSSCCTFFCHLSYLCR